MKNLFLAGEINKRKTNIVQVNKKIMLVIIPIIVLLVSFTVGKYPMSLKQLFIVFVIGIIPLMFLRWKLNVLSFDEEEARALGVNVNVLRIVVILCSTLMTASVVSVAGLIGWVGLVVPHFARMFVGPNFKDLLLASILIGGSFLLFVDNLTRCIGSLEIPLGVLISIIGVPFFVYLMINVKKGCYEIRIKKCYLWIWIKINCSRCFDGS